MFFQDKKLKLSASVWKRILWNLTKFQLYQTTNRKSENNNCLNALGELKLVRFHEILYQTDTESFSFLSWKTKKAIVSKYAKIDPKDGASSPNFQWRFCFARQLQTNNCLIIECKINSKIGMFTRLHNVYLIGSQTLWHILQMVAY